MTSIRAVRALTVAALVLLLGACGDRPAAGPREEPRWVTAAEATAEYHQTASGLALAGGWAWPVRPVVDHGPDGAPVRFERGYGRSSAQYYWYCSWATRAVDRSLSRTARDRALAQALQLREMAYYRSGLNARNQRFVDRILDEAATGRMRRMRLDVRTNCAPS